MWGLPDLTLLKVASGLIELADRNAQLDPALQAQSITINVHIAYIPGADGVNLHMVYFLRLSTHITQWPLFPNQEPQEARHAVQ